MSAVSPAAPARAVTNEEFEALADLFFGARKDGETVLAALRLTVNATRARSGGAIQVGDAAIDRARMLLEGEPDRPMPAYLRDRMWERLGDVLRDFAARATPPAA